jgi:hypothetical protein
LIPEQSFGAAFLVEESMMQSDLQGSNTARAPTGAERGWQYRGLPLSKLLNLAAELALRLDMHIPSSEQLRKKLTEREAVPQIYTNRRYRLWIDRYYIAVDDLDTNRVQYVYLTRAHIRAELRTDSQARKAGRQRLLDAATLSQYHAALAEINAAHRAYVVRRQNPTPGDTAPPDLEAPWGLGCA